MLFAFAEDGELHIHESVADAARQWEGIDVESGVVHFYDENGTYLEPKFITPNRRGKLLWLFNWIESGTYDLVPNPTATEDSFALALYETKILSTNTWFTSLEQLKAALSSKGVAVELQSNET